ncbi:(2Fe-2S)-binding protein [Cloacibacillus evryensis]|uniref:(2Fe-2S)-binding protein n=1 Tax=Cloacibacillus evryensis TaxID=508460 RepID=UPI002B201BAD|nr:(2Fe-2S)-binding protein [Cloacibacillus evryensis]MEA5035457.1 (2Fe-2S)-binding protein [Cloacibacillus evryensis]
MTLNGKTRTAEVEADTRLIDMLRNSFRLTGVKEGCGAGECGACTVLLDDEAVCSCVVPAVQSDGHSVTTIEGLEENGELDALQQAFIDCDAVQCGFCTPGMIMSAKALLLKNPHPNRDEIKRALAGNVCRCTGYIPIVNAVSEAAERLGGNGR